MPGFDQGIFDTFGEPSFSGGSFTDAGGAGTSAGYDASASNGENQGIDSNVANAWWRSIHPDMNAEGIAGDDAGAYPTPPDWFTGKGGNVNFNTNIDKSNWVMQQDPYTDYSGNVVNPYGNAGGGNGPALSPAQLLALNWPGFEKSDTPSYMVGGQGGWASLAGQPNSQESTLGNLAGTGGQNGQEVGDNTGLNPEFLQWMKDSGYTAGVNNQEGQQTRTQVFDKDMKPIGPEDSFVPELDNDFALAMAAASSAFGAGMGGLAVGAGGQFTPTWLGGAAQGFGGALGGALARGGPTLDALKAAGMGAVTGGLTSGFNPAGALGVDDPSWAKPINNATGAAIRSGLVGGDIKGSVLGSLTNSALSAGMNGIYNGVKNMDWGNGDGGGDVPDVTGMSGGGDATDWRTSLGLGMSTPAGGNSQFPQYFGGQSPNASYATVNSETSDPYAGMDMIGNGQQPGQRPNGPNPLMTRFMPQNAGGGANGAGRFDSMAGNLMGLYSAYRNRRMAGKQAGNLQSLFSQNSPYAKQLEQTLMRQDAAAGRRSQVGPRQVELQARLAEMNSKNAPMLQSLYNQKSAAGDMMLKNLLGLGMNGNFSSGIDQLKNWWDSNQSNTANNNSDYAPGD